MVIIGIFVLILGFNSFNENLQSQKQFAENLSQVKNVDNSLIMKENGLSAETNKKPIIEKRIFHMKKGNYSSFDYYSLINAKKYDYTNINQNLIYYSGTINGNKDGVNILYYTIFDNEGNYTNCKIAVIIEGSESNDMILNYENGKIE